MWCLLLAVSICPQAMADESLSLPCYELPSRQAALSSRQENAEGDFSGVDAGSTGFLDPAGEECDPDEETLFNSSASGDADYVSHAGSVGSANGAAGAPDVGDDEDEEDEENADDDEGHRASSHTAFTLSRTPSAGLRSIVRHRATHHAWSHVVEMRGDSLTRRRLVWHHAGGGPAWRVAAGDMTDTALRLWPRGLPRRTLPAGWVPAHGTPEAPQPWSAPVPQGVGAGVFHAGWSAYALRTWNPVTTQGDRPWDPAWNLHHEVAGASIPWGRHGDGARPWHLLLHASTTRVTRAAPPLTPGDTLSPPLSGGTGMHPLSERMLATEILSPARGLTLTAAASGNDRARPGPAGRGALLGVVLRARAARSPRYGTLDLEAAARQRSAGWASAWDPALTAARLDDLSQAQDAPAPPDPEAGRSGDGSGWGAGEVRAAGRWTAPRSAREGPAPRGSIPARLTLELRRAWDPVAGTARRSVRGAVAWRLEDARLTVSGTRRVSRAASGSLSLYHFVQADARMTRFPRGRVTAWRAWNGNGPLRAGIFLGAEPAWTIPSATRTATLSAAPGLKLEVNTAAARETWTTFASLGLRVRVRAWTFEAAAGVPVPLGPDETQGRIALSATRSVTR